MASAPI
jgi:hypothetical protein